MGQRLWPWALGLLAWQCGSILLGAGEYVYDLPATPIVVVASSVTALGWLALAAWSGLRQLRAFPVVAAVVWGLTIASLLVVAMLRPWEGGAVDAWRGLFLLPLLFGAGPLHGLGSLLPAGDQTQRTLLVAGTLLALSLATHHVALRAGQKSPVDLR